MTTLPEVSRDRLYVFVLLFLLYLAPLFRALPDVFLRERSNIVPLACDKAENGLLAWLVLISALYVFLRFIGRCLPIKAHTKDFAHHKNDVVTLVGVGLIIGVVGRAGVRMHSGDAESITGMTFPSLVVWYTLFYTVLFEVLRPVKLTLSSDIAGNLPALVISLASFVVLLGVLLGHLVLAISQPAPFRNSYLIWVALGAAVHFMLFGIHRAPGVDGQAHLHLHHWYWPVPMALTTVFPTDMSMLAQAMFVGIALHGLACFGAEPLFYPDALMARSPSLFELRIKTPTPELTTEEPPWHTELPTVPYVASAVSVHPVKRRRWFHRPGM